MIGHFCYVKVNQPTRKIAKSMLSVNITPTGLHFMKWHKSDFALNTFLTFISSALVKMATVQKLYQPQNLLAMVKLLNES